MSDHKIESGDTVQLPASVIRTGLPLLVGLTLGGGASTGLWSISDSHDVAQIGEKVSRIEESLSRLRIEIAEDQWSRQDHDRWVDQIYAPGAELVRIRLDEHETRIRQLEKTSSR